MQIFEKLVDIVRWLAAWSFVLQKNGVAVGADADSFAPGAYGCDGGGGDGGCGD